MRLIIIAVGRLKAGPERDLCVRYGDRIRVTAKAIGITDVKTIEISESRQRRPDDRKAEEAEQIYANVPEGGTLVLFDETGKSPTSEAFAAIVQQHRQATAPALALVIGGPDGIAPALRSRAREILSFGHMTLPHQLVRALVFEQVYRAVTILTGHPYHRV